MRMAGCGQLAGEKRDVGNAADRPRHRASAAEPGKRAAAQRERRTPSAGQVYRCDLGYGLKPSGGSTPIAAEFDPAQTWRVAVTWRQFEQSRPDLAEAGRALLYQFGVGLAFLATVRRDGGPRVHPMCPLIYHGGLYGFIVPGPKQGDLHRDGRYSLHSFPCADNEDAFYCTGRAAAVDDPVTRKALAELFVTERAALKVPEPGAQDHLFSFGLQHCLLTQTTGHGDSDPQHTIWHNGRP